MMNKTEFSKQSIKLFNELSPTVDDWLNRFDLNVVIGALLSAAYGIEPTPRFGTKKGAMQWLDDTKRHSDKAYKIHADEITTNAEYK